MSNFFHGIGIFYHKISKPSYYMGVKNRLRSKFLKINRIEVQSQMLNNQTKINNLFWASFLNHLREYGLLIL